MENKFFKLFYFFISFTLFSLGISKRLLKLLFNTLWGRGGGLLGTLQKFECWDVQVCGESTSTGRATQDLDKNLATIEGNFASDSRAAPGYNFYKKKLLRWPI
jgi:hypothetical protein